MLKLFCLSVPLVLFICVGLFSLFLASGLQDFEDYL